MAENGYPGIALEIKIVNGTDYVRMGVLPVKIRQQVLAHPDFRMEQVRTMHVCCYTYDSYLEKEYFLTLKPDL